MKVGDYVRTKQGRIGKISNLTVDYSSELILCEESSIPFAKHQIIKSSPNIIDLISEDDLLKIEYELASGEKQTEVVQVIKNFKGKLFVNLWIGKFFIEELEHYNKHIKSIVTKEQFERMQYNLESEVN